MKYMIMIYGAQRDYDAMAGQPDPGRSGPAQPGWTADQFAAMGEFMEAFNKELADSGELVETRGLTAPVHTRRIQFRAGAPVVTDGPYAESEEVLAGYWIVECDSFDRATQIAARLTETPGPDQARDRARVDVRPVAESRHELDA
jgi:hypothetical protein